MIPLYRPGSGLLHRIPAGVKLGSLALSAIVIMAAVHDLLSAGIALTATVVLYLVAGFHDATILKETWRLRWLTLVLGGALAVFVSPQVAVVNTSRVVVLMLLAALLTLTTPVGALLDTLHRMLRPLRPLGVNADAVALTLLLALTLVPFVADVLAQVRAAHAARGVRMGRHALLPVLVRVLRHADDVGDALSARGLA